MRVLIECGARPPDLRTLFLEHAAGNEAAGALYGRFGFSRIGRRRAYYERRGGGREDAITLRCDLAGVRYSARKAARSNRIAEPFRCSIHDTIG